MIYSAASPERSNNSISAFISLAITLLICLASFRSSFGQVAIPTSRSDNQRTGANVNEYILTPNNVNSGQFGSIFSYSVDDRSQAQPLYVPNVNIPGRGTHNVVYVATMGDSVYALDADSNVGDNAAPLWYVNFTDPANGITTASGANLPCAKEDGFTQEGIVGTPTIDTATGTMYLLAKTVENGTVRHHLHALDITNGAEKFGGPILITASSVSLKGHMTHFNSLHQLNRPGLLLLNGYVYMGFGSNGCNDGNTGWLLAYDASSLQQVGSFNTSPDVGLTSIWQTGNGLAADEDGNIYAVTAESAPNNPGADVPNGGQSYAHAVLKLTPNPDLPNSLAVGDYFIPSLFAYLNQHDLDLSSGGPVLVPDQGGPNPHLMVAAGKQGTIYVLNRDAMGMYSPNDVNLGLDGGEELTFAVGAMFSSPAYWNGMLYYAGDADPVKAFALTGVPTNPLSSEPVMATAQKYVGSHSPSISANGNTNGILWVMSGTNLYAFNAANLQQQLYNSTQVKGRDTLQATGHFATQTIANGKVYIATQTALQVYGLLPNLTLASGGNQSGTILTTLPAPIQVQVVDAYYGTGVGGVTVTFSDGGKKGTFHPATVVSDDDGYVSTSYTFSKTAGTYTITASSPNTTSVSFTETALPGAPWKIISYSGTRQTGQAGTVLPNPLKAKVEDIYLNGIAGITVTFVDKSGLGTLNPVSGVTNASGIVQTNYQLPNSPGTYTVTANALSLTAAQFKEFATGKALANLAVTSGNNQTAPINTALPQPVVVQVTDSSGGPVPGVAVTFSAPSGTFTTSSAKTDTNGSAAVNYTTGPSPGPVTITATVNTLTTQIEVNVVGNAATVTVSGGNNQAGTAGTTLPQALTVVVVDQYGNPVPGVLVNYSDGGAGGSFSNPNPATTDSAGTASQFYMLPLAAGTVTITATASGVSNPAVFAENSVPGPPANAIAASGNNQSGAAGTQLPQALTALVTDRFGNPVAGVNVNFDDGGAGGTFSNPNPIATSASGTAAEFYTFSPSLGTVTVTAAAVGVTNPAAFTENSVSGPATSVYVTLGNNQSASAGTQLPQALAVIVTDQYGNPVAGVNVNFSDGGAGGVFSNPGPVATDNTGTATDMYTLPPNPGTVSVYAAAAGVAIPAVFTETAL